MQLQALRPIFLTSLFFSVHMALLSYLNSSMLESAVGPRGTTLAYTFGSMVAIIGVAIAPLIARRLGARTFLIASLLSIAVVLALLANATGPAAALFFILYFSLTTITWYALDLVLEHFCRQDTVGNVRGFYLGINNIGWVLAPVASSSIVAVLGLKAPYALGVGLIVLSLVISRFIPRFGKSRHLPHASLKDAFAALNARPNIRRLLVLYFILHFFFAWMVVYLVPYLTNLGFGWQSIGIILSIMLLPFVVVQYPIGRLVDKFHMERSLLVIGFSLAAVFTLGLALDLPFTAGVYALVLFGTRVGAAIIEVSAESAFFKRVKEDDTALVGILRMMMPLAYVTAPLFASVIVGYLSYQVLFGVLAGIMALTGFYALRFNSDTN